MSLDDDLDRLYQLPLTEFTSARNELAKRAGARAAEVKKLSKPPVAAWAVNQLHTKDRRAYETLVEAAEALRTAHKVVLAGKRGDLRFASKEHEEAVESALKATLAILADAGHPVTDATRHAISQTLRALPSDEPPGRLSHALQPGGFEMLAGITIKGGGAGARAISAAAPKPADKKATPPGEDKKWTEARDDAAAAARDLREAEHAARRAEFEAARAARATTKAGEALADARADLEKAQTRLEEAEAEAAKADRENQTARKAVEAAEREVVAVRKRAEAAQKTFDRLSPRR
jgi:hypothetical protein